MKITTLLFIFSLYVFAGTATSFAQTKKDTTEPIFGTYDVKADPNLQLQHAIENAKQSEKRILVEVGGEWCKWCHYLDSFFEKNPDVTAYLKQRFVLIKVNFSPANENKQFLLSYPKPAGYPHLYVLDTDGRLLHSQDTAKLEKGQGYDRAAVMEFLNTWALKDPSPDF
ncbi:MAG: thioredoxin family protein [Bacteroidota bacterium]